MKKKYILILSLVIGICISNKTFGQSLSVSGSLFLPQDSIGFTYSKPAFTSTDWIGIYKIDQTPGGPASASWGYIKSDAGILYLKAPKDAGKYKAYLFCCDGFDIVSTSVEFSIEIPSLTTPFATYVKGDSMVFSYVSPRFSETDWIGIYPSGTKPGSGNPSIDWKYIPNSSGKITFKTALNPETYDAYLLCCDGYDSISACTFEVIDANIAFITPKTQNFEAGATLEFAYNDPAFVPGDWIGIYKDGEPTTGPSITWSLLVSKSGTVSFPGNLVSGVYFAALFNNSQTEYARSVSFEIATETTGSYVKTAASVYPENTTILVNYKDENHSDKDLIGIYKKAQIPGGPEALVWNYALSDSSTIEFNSLPIGEYTVYLLCCDGYNIKAKSDFKVVDLNTPSLVLSAISYKVGDAIEFIYNDPNFDSGGGTDWIGIYNQGDIPSDVRSIVWDYLKDSNGTMTFSVPYPNGMLVEADPTLPLGPGEYYAGLFCCDAYGLYAQTSFIVTDKNNGIYDYSLANKLSLFPNPTNGLVNLRMTDGNNLQRITVYNLTGQVIYQEKLAESVNVKTLDLKYLTKGIYFIEALTEKYKSSKKLIIQ